MVIGETMDKLTRGKLAEEEAVTALRELGYRILERNFRTRLGELDIICEHEDCLIFVEVRSRKGARFGLPQETVNWAKQAQVRRMAWQYLKMKGSCDRNCRFDVIGIVFDERDQLKTIDIINDAF